MGSQCREEERGMLAANHNGNICLYLSYNTISASTFSRQHMHAHHHTQADARVSTLAQSLIANAITLAAIPGASCIHRHAVAM